MDESMIDAQALRLMRAFYRVSEPESRDLIVQLAEAAERGAKITKVADHLLLPALKPG
jgi:hypothetical protein